jgi:Ca2+-binding RTX toxin-like protein
MPNTKLSTPVAATAQNNPGAEPRLISAVVTDGAAPQFKIPFSSQAIQSVESVDLDLVLTTATGEKIILQQGALQAATQPDSKIVFQNGDSITAADQIKKLGILKPVEGGSFRLKSGDASPAVAEKVTGDAFGLGKELQDTMSQLTETSKQLEKVLQTLTTASLSTTTDDAKPITAGPGTGTGVQKITPQSDKFASPSPGSPPKPEVEEFTSNNTNNNTSNNTATATATSTNASNIKVTNTLRGLYAEKGDVISNVQVVDKIKTAALTPGEREQGIEVLKNFSQASLREMLPEDPLQVRIRGADPVNLEPSGLALNTLVMPGVLNATSVRFELPAGSALPTGFKLNGKAFEDGVIVVPAASLVDLKLPIEWAVISQDQTVTAFDFQLGVKYLDAKGSELEQGRAPLTFTYGELKNLADTVQLDGNSNSKVFLSAYGYSYEVLGDANGNAIVAGVGNDILNGAEGEDTLQGGAGDDTYVVDNAGDVVIENPEKGTDTVQASVNYSLTSHVENLTLTGTSHINGTGNTLDNLIIGNSGNNRLDGGEGADTMRGGAGNDTYVVSNVGDVVFEHANEGTDTVEAAISYTLTDHFENLTLTGTNDINGTGNDLNNLIIGNSGDNRLEGGAGVDTLQGGAGNDTYVVNNNADVVFENANEGSDTVETSISYTLTDNVENLTLTGTSHIDGIGNSLDNLIIGNSGNSRLDGGEGLDTLKGGAGNDTYVVDNVGDVVFENFNEGTDTVEASINYTLTGHVENLTLTGTDDLNGTGNDLNNLIIGNSGNNRLNGGAGVDTLQGGAGNDTYVVNIVGDVVSENLNMGTDTVEAAITYTLTPNVENLTLTGTSNIDGTGNEHNNLIIGNIGNNRLNGGTGADTIRGGDGNDIYVVDNVGDRVEENARQGMDLVEASINYTLTEHVENLTLTGTDNLNGIGNGLANTITGNRGNNRLDGGAGADTLIGGLGNDTYVVDNPGDEVTEAANAGTDTVEASVNYTLTAHVENLILTGAATIGTGNDLNNTLTANQLGNTLNGGAGADTLLGGDGQDSLDGAAGADSMLGGKGDDTYVVDNAGDLIIESFNEGNDTVRSSISYNLTAQVENLILTGNDNLTGLGNDLANNITGNGGNNNLMGGLGADTIDGGGGNNTASYNVSNAGVQVSLVAGAINSGGHAQGDVLTNIHNLLGSAHDDTLIGNDWANRLEGGLGADRLDGGAENDTLVGAEGNDVLNGEEGDDLIFGGAGADTIDGGDGIDTASYSGSDAAVTVNLALGSGTGGHAEGDDLSNIENLIGSSAYGDTLTGNTGANRIEGGGGNDTLDGGGGLDTLVGGAGNDTYILNEAGVTITEALGEGTDTVISSINYTLGANLENMTLTGNATIGTGNTLNNTLTANNSGNTLSGGDGDDSLIGGTGNDTLNGDAGNDTLRATAGNNTLNGGVGNDTLVAGTGNDTLMGGEGNDTLDLRTHNLSLEGDVADGGAGTDTVIINQSLNTGTAMILDGGSGFDTLQVWGVTGAKLDLNNLNATNFERLDLRTDGAATQVSLSSAGIMKLINNSSGVDVLNLRMGSNDTYTIAAEETANVTQGQSVSFYNGAIAPANLIAQVNFEYV